MEQTAATRKKNEEDLANLRDKVCFTVYLLNALWLIFILVLQGNKAAQFEIFLYNGTNPANEKVADTLSFLGFDEKWKFDAIDTIVIVLFGTLFMIQFVSHHAKMLYDA